VMPTHTGRTAIRTAIKRDEGSVLLLGIGLIGVLMLAISVVVDASLAFVQRQALQARADTAVLAGVRRIDLDHYYIHGATETSKLIPREASASALAHIELEQVTDPIPGLEVVRILGHERRLTAELTAPIQTAFWPIEATITVRSSASLDYVG